MTTASKWILGISISLVVILLILLSKGCQSPSSTTTTGTLPSVPTTIIKDSGTTVRQQELVIIQSQATIEALQDSVEKLSEKLTGIKPQFIVRYVDTLRTRDSLIPYIHNSTDSLMIDSLTQALDESSGKIDAFLVSRSWIPIPKYFIDSGRFFKIQGTIRYRGVDINNLEVYNKTSVVIGQKSSLFSTGPVTVTVTQDNPMMSAGPLQSFQYVPKTRKWSLVAGPAIIFNGKTFTQGVGLMAGYTIFSK